MHRLRRALGILGRAEAQGLSAHSGTGAQVFERTRAAISRELKNLPDDGLPERGLGSEMPRPGA
jgi:hypothetical protein